MHVHIYNCKQRHGIGTRYREYSTPILEQIPDTNIGIGAFLVLNESITKKRSCTSNQKILLLSHYPTHSNASMQRRHGGLREHATNPAGALWREDSERHLLMKNELS